MARRKTKSDYKRSPVGRAKKRMQVRYKKGANVGENEINALMRKKGLKFNPKKMQIKI